MQTFRAVWLLNNLTLEANCVSVMIKMLPLFKGGGGVLVEKQFCSFFNPAISLYIYYDQYEKILRKKSKKIFFPRLVSMEMAAIFDFRALTKVHLTSKPLLQMR